MANYFYVKSGGTASTATATATTDPTTKRTGAWSGSAGDHFPDIQTALLGDDTYAPTAGDYIYVSDAHTKTYTATTQLSLSGANCVCVSNSDVEALSTGAYEEAVNGNNTIRYELGAGVNGSSYVYGMHIGSYTEPNFGAYSGANMLAENCTVKCLSNVNYRSFNSVKGDGAIGKFKNLEYYTAGSNSVFYMSAGANVTIDNLTLHASGTAINVLYDGAGNGSGVLTIKNTDLSSVMSSTGYMFGAMSSIEDLQELHLERCKLPASWSLYASAPSYPNCIFSAVSCDTGDGYHYFHYRDNFGEVSEHTATTYKSATYDGTNGFSTLMESSASACKEKPLRFKLCELPAQDLTATTTYTVHFTTATTLTDTEFWIELVRPDATDNALGVMQTTRPSAHFGAGTSYTDNADVWTGGQTNTFSDTISVAGMTGVNNGTVEIYVNLGKASVDVYVDPAVTIT